MRTQRTPPGCRLGAAALPWDQRRRFLRAITGSWSNGGWLPPPQCYLQTGEFYRWLDISGVPTRWAGEARRDGRAGATSTTESLPRAYGPGPLTHTIPRYRNTRISYSILFSIFARLATALTIYAQGTVRASDRKFLHASCRCLGGFERSSLTSLYAITVSDEGIFNPAWPQGRPALRSVAHPLRERVPAAKRCALMLRMSMAAVRFQRG